MKQWRFVRLIKSLLRYFIIGGLCFIAGAAVFLIHGVRSGPDLSTWHTIELDAEYSTDSRDVVQTFDDYLRMEDTLFRELDEKIYANTESGLAYAVARYSDGSAADPRQRNPNWNRSYVLPGKPDGDGVLLVHGMSDSPYSLRVLGQQLQKQGYWVIGLRLPGHGTAPAGLKSATWEDMADSVEIAMRGLKELVNARPVHIIGYSVGAALAVDYTLKMRDNQPGIIPASLVLISPAIGITPVAAYAGWLDNLARLPGMQKLAWQSTLPEFDPYKYNSFTNNAAFQTHRLTQSVASRIKALTVDQRLTSFPPTLVFLSAADATVSVDAVIDNLMSRLAPEQHELMLFDINRTSIHSTLLVKDPGPLTAQLFADNKLPFTFSLITNRHDETSAVEIRKKAAKSSQVDKTDLDLVWPIGLISLSHVALPFPPQDKLYGRSEYSDENELHLGQMEVQGERGLLLFPSSWLLRVRYNPFYTVLESHTLDWLGRSSSAAQE